ncbi:MAG: hypothetical protein A2848_02140 [Candidatus Magasanikbacteria bacterium RIFCSPHIGHO2_01_FULL_50_8]|uniref:Uncharacterized protein n=2 Tax=Candidatus Magasanikiibacteriota TaxID=1752731 RepID=A0A1F6LR70_9BACT|nr:MAG: hypothetical protein A2848_02140 [Candidatus Magasanikbacteria bacterium RIFCSPHIGHO2_01_FULL_50_8]OGH67697.1 MAG: hypothetical protein A3C15_02755 [Candidatus Magasanikbacteria bacterium RIFCSPHIGHO2_02_FULL_50_9b]
MPTIVTHLNPHLDEVVCIWMVRRFLPRWNRCTVKYVATNPHGGSVKATDRDSTIMYIGVGRGKFDEHKGNLDESATTLVYTFLVGEKKIKLATIERAALAELVAFVNDDDHGKHITQLHSEFSFSTANAFMPRTGMKSAAILTAGAAYLDGVFECLLEKHLLERDWKKMQLVKTRVGRAVAVQTEASAKTVLRRASREGIQIAIVLNPKNKFRSIRAVPESPADFSDAFQRAHALEPHAEWYLHHSKKMLICGSDVAANVTLSKMSLAALIQLVAV